MFLYKQIQNLDEETRNIMYLRILGNLSYEEISEITGKSINVIRVKFFRGKEKIIKEKNKYE
jgi:RNA polymerase sigma-70 factor (ECF subfamily)